jgi:hypothetical protein
VQRVLADPATSRTQMDVLTGGATDIVKTLEADGAPGRAGLVASFEAALRRLEADATLSRGDRLGAVIARVNLARLGQAKDVLQPALPDALRKDVRDHVSRLDRETTDGYERQAVITAGAYALGHAGLWTDSDALLKANLSRSHSPYYLMSQLGSNARKLGRNDEALRWYERQERRPGHALAVGFELPRRAGRPGAAGRRAHRKSRLAVAGRSGQGQRCLRGPQRAFAEARRHQAGGLDN